MTPITQLAEEHVQAALHQAAAEFPDFAVDSWSEAALEGQWVVLQDDDGRSSQVQLKDRITLGVPLKEGQVGGGRTIETRPAAPAARSYRHPRRLP